MNIKLKKEVEITTELEAIKIENKLSYLGGNMATREVEESPTRRYSDPTKEKEI
jgi:hypothetical protein